MLSSKERSAFMDTERRGWWIGPSGSAACGLLLAGCLGPIGGGGLLGDASDFVNLDKDGDEAVTVNEFSKWGKDQGVLDAFMGDTKGEIASTALSQGLYDIWDIEGSGITEAEWSEGLRAWFPDGDTQEFTSWDLDQDGTLDRDELVAGFAHTDLLSGWDDDSDGALTMDETYRRFYDVFDGNSDGTLTSDEWTAGLASWNWGF